MKKILLLFCLIACMSVSVLQSKAGYRYASVSGTAVSKTLHSLAGVNIPLQLAVLNANDTSSYVQLSFPVSEGVKSSLLRICSGCNLVTPGYLSFRTMQGVEVCRMDVSLASYYQWFQQELMGEEQNKMLSAPLRIFFCSDKTKEFSLIVQAEKAALFAPHVWSGKGDPKRLFLEHFASRNSLNSYGWQSGCVLDGLASLADARNYASDASYASALTDQLGLYFPEGVSKKLSSIENTPSVAQLALANPAHPDLQKTLQFWNSKRDSLGGIHSGKKAVAEGSYTVAWPLAILARQLDRPDLAEDAVHQLRSRRDRLVDEQGLIWLRHDYSKNPARTYKMWSRGLTWYFLGLAKTLDVLPEPPADLIQEYARTAKVMLQYQSPEGLWHLFADDATTILESSGSAGIAAAWAIGIRRGWIDASYKAPLTKAMNAFEKYFLSPDGLVTGVAPNNKSQGGEAFQRDSKGTMLQFGMGLYAMALAEYSELP